MKYLSSVYNSFIWSMIIAISSFKIEWLEMRVNIGYIFFISLIILSISTVIAVKKEKAKFNKIFTSLNLVICSIYGITLYGFNRIKIVPASIIREGIHENKLSFSSINTILLLIIIIGFFMIVFLDKMNKKKTN